MNTTRAIILVVAIALVPLLADAATSRGPRLRRPAGENLNCRPEVREVMGGECHCIKNAIKENVPPYEGQQVRYQYYCSSNHLDKLQPGDVCVYHATCDPGDPVIPRDPWRPDLPPFGVYNPSDIFP